MTYSLLALPFIVMTAALYKRYMVHNWTPRENFMDFNYEDHKVVGDRVIYNHVEFYSGLSFHTLVLNIRNGIMIGYDSNKNEIARFRLRARIVK